MKKEKIDILYEDKDLMVLNKPAGLMVHGDGRTSEKTLCDWIVDQYPALEKVGEPINLQASSSQLKAIPRPGIVHRLDKETTGVIIIAKTQVTHEFLKQQFQEKSISKIYHCFVYGRMKEKKGFIDRAIARSRKDFRLWSAQRGARGKEREALTEYRVIGINEEATFVEVMPRTGRTHQIRVHFKALNYPVVCDKLYAPKKDCILGFDRLALHAFSVEFLLPNGKTKTVEAPYPNDFKKAVKIFKQ